MAAVAIAAAVASGAAEVDVASFEVSSARFKTVQIMLEGRQSIQDGRRRAGGEDSPADFHRDVYAPSGCSVRFRSVAFTDAVKG